MNAQTGQRSYTTNFPNYENPISEGGNWVNGGTTGVRWANVRTVSGLAYGTQSGSTNYNDSTAVLTGTWGPDQTAQATVKIGQSDSGSGLFEEVELRLRTKITAYSITGYEINCSVIAANPYLQIVRWNGAFGSWTQLDGRPVSCKNGDVLKATIVGSTITAYKNGAAVFSVNDSTFASGAPGIGFYLQGGSSTLNSHFGFSSFTAASQGTTTSSDTTAPSIPTNLSLSSVSSNGASIRWSASTDNVGVAGYQVFRQGVKIGTTTTTSFNDSGLSANTSYSYSVAAYDAANNLSAQSQPLSVTTSSSSQTSTTPRFVQTSQAQIGSGSSVSAAFNGSSTRGNTIVAYVIWDNSSTATLSDSQGNTFTPVSARLVWGGTHSAQVFYASNIVGGVDTITARFGSTLGAFGVLYIHEYAGISPTNPVDATVSATGSSSTLSSGVASTTSTNDLIFGAGVSDNVVTGVGTNFSGRNLSYGNITQDRAASTTGTYSATATHNGNAWGMQMVAFRPAGTTSTPTTWSISGTISGGAGSTVALSGASSSSTVADANGYFSFTGIVNGTYTVTPTKSGYTFTPTSKTVTVNGANVTGTNFTATANPQSTYSLSGAISTGGAGATVSLGGAKSSSTIADGNGNFSFAGLVNGTYTVTPTKSGYTFTPTSKTVTVSGANVTGTNFTATANPQSTYSLSGAITPSTGGAGATVSLGGAKSSSTIADGNGNFSFAGLVNGTYTVTPSKSGYTFSPTSKSVTVNGANVTGTNFTATATSSGHWVDLTWNASTSSTVSGYKVYRSTNSGGPYALLNSAPVTSTVYSDLGVAAGITYYYVVTAVDSAGNESAYSNQTTAVVPNP